jgi:hypothetical protein
MKKPTLALQKNLYLGKRKNPMRRSNFGDACGSWDTKTESRKREKEIQEI